MCALAVEKGTFTKRSGTGSQTVTLANSSITPKVLWLWTSGVTTANAYAEHFLFSYGFSDGTNDACIAAVAVDNLADSTTAGSIRDDSAICMFNTNTANPNIATVASKADVTSFNAGNFILNWSTATSAAEIIHYMVVGGSDITNVKVVSDATGTTSTGNRAYTGFEFQGDFINLLGARNISLNTELGEWAFSNGAATSSSAQWQHGTYSEHDASSSAAKSTFSTADILQVQRGTSIAFDGQARFVSFDSSGYTINWIDAPNVATQRLAALIIKGGVWNVGNGAAPATATTQDISTTASTDTKGVMMFSHGGTTTPGSLAFVAHAKFNIGGADSTLAEGSTSVHDTDAATNMISTRYSSDTKIIRSHTAAATASSSTTNAEADISSMSTSGQYTISWSTTQSGLRYAWFAASQGVSTTPVSETSIHKYDIIANIVQTSIQKYNLFAYIAQNSIHKYHLLNDILQSSIHKYDILVNALQSSIHKYDIIQNILQASIHKYDILNFVDQTSTHKYNLLNDIIQTSIHKYHLFQNALQTSIHKYHMDGLVAALSLHKYDILQNIVQISVQKYDLLNNVLQSSLHKYHLFQDILQSSIQKYDILQNIIQSSLHKYHLIANVLQSSIHKYDLLANILQSSIHKYDIEVLGAVANALIVKYDMLQYIVQTNVHKYNILQDIMQASIHKYNLLVNIFTTSSQKYDILQDILQTSLHKYALLQNVIQSSIHKYDILAEALTVLADSIHKYHLFANIAQSSIHKYDLLNTIAQTSIHKYNLLANVLRTSIHKYGMGGIIASQSKHLYNIIREILGSSVAGGVAKKPTLKQIRYPVYRIEELRKLELRRRLKGTEAVVIPAFQQNIHHTIAPFIITNPVTGRVTVRFAIAKEEPVSFASKEPIPIKIAAKTNKNAANKGKSSHVMQQKTIEKYGRQLNKLSKIMTLFFLHEQLKDD